MRRNNFLFLEENFSGLELNGQGRSIIRIGEEKENFITLVQGKRGGHGTFLRKWRETKGKGTPSLVSLVGANV